MSRTMVGLLAAVGAAMAVLVAFAHGDSVPIMIMSASGATGLAAYLAAPPQKKSSGSLSAGRTGSVTPSFSDRLDDCSHEAWTSSFAGRIPPWSLLTGSGRHPSFLAGGSESALLLEPRRCHL